MTSQAPSRTRLPWPAVAVVGALAVIGVVTLVQWVIAIFAWLITLLMMVVVMVGLGYWLVAELRRR